MREFFEDNATGRLSSKRLVLIMAGSALSISTVMLAVAAMLGHGEEGALWAVTTPLAALAGGGYVGGKAAERGKAPA